MNTESELIQACRKGNRVAFDTLTKPYRERIRRYLVMMICHEVHADDLLQESLRRAWVALPTFEPRGKFLSWIFRIAVNLARNHIRDEARRARSENPESLELKYDVRMRRRTVLSSLVRHEMADLLAVAIDQLPPTLRESFVLHYVERLSYDEMEEITGVRVGTLHVRSLRARSLLRNAIGSTVDSWWMETPAC